MELEVERDPPSRVPEGSKESPSKVTDLDDKKKRVTSSLISLFHDVESTKNNAAQ